MLCVVQAAVPASTLVVEDLQRQLGRMEHKLEELAQVRAVYWPYWVFDHRCWTNAELKPPMAAKTTRVLMAL